MMTRTLTPLAVMGAVGLCASAAAAPDSPQTDPAQSRMIRYAEGSSARHGDQPKEPLLVEDLETEARTLVTKPRASDSSVASGSFGNFWIYAAETELFFDLDGDGYYHTLRVRFDADTFFADAYVYAELYLSWDGENWERYFVTEDFLIQGSTSLDEYEVETEFVAGYPTGLYDVLIELYDADFATFEDEFGPFQSSDFSILPIEDIEHDGPPPVAVTVSHGHGGGALSWLWVAALAAALGLRIAHSRAGRRNRSAPRV